MTLADLLTAEVLACSFIILLGYVVDVARSSDDSNDRGYDPWFWNHYHRADRTWTGS
jgi:hypothetical protein